MRGVRDREGGGVQAKTVTKVLEVRDNVLQSLNVSGLHQSHGGKPGAGVHLPLVPDTSKVREYATTAGGSLFEKLHDDDVPYLAVDGAYHKARKSKASLGRVVWVPDPDVVPPRAAVVQCPGSPHALPKALCPPLKGGVERRGVADG